MIIVLLFIAFFLGIPISFALGGISLIGILSSGLPIEVVTQRMFSGVDSYALIAIPLFIFAGELMSEGGISNRLISFANALVGHWPSGLAMVTVLASMFFAAITGSAIAATAAIGGVMIPLMTKEGYHKSFSAPLVATAGSIGPIIPPSIPLLVYGNIVNASIAKLFMGGIVPGILMGVALMVVSFFIGKKRNYRGRNQRAPIGEIFKYGKDAILALLTPIIIIGGIMTGVFTATESGAIGVLYAFILGMFVYRELTMSKLWLILKRSAVTTATVLFVVANASLFAYYLTINQIPQTIASMIATFANGPIMFLLIVNIILLIAGTFIDTISAVVIFTPLFYPLLSQFGIDPIHFGIIVAVNLTIGMCTPPLGVDLFVASSISKISIREMWHDLIPMLTVLIVVLFMITYFPATVMGVANLIK